MKLCVVPTFLFLMFFPLCIDSALQVYDFQVVLTNITKLCATKSIVTVNGKFPGPTLYAKEDDNIIVRVANHVHYNVTIHWHGIRQLRSGWADGPAYITQCPIPPGESFLYNFTATGQRGTLLWHAHISWLRATVHGAIVILPKNDSAFPFPKPDSEEIVILGEWWKPDIEDLIRHSSVSGLPPNVSDAHTVNGEVGPVAGCVTQGFNLTVEAGKTYLLRLINAAVNDQLFFKIADHNLTVVEVDASYVKPFEADTVFLGPGQTTNALLTADRNSGKYLIAVSPFMDTVISVDNKTATAFLIYNNTPPFSVASLTLPTPINATEVTSGYLTRLRSLNSDEYPAKVPLNVDHSLLFTVGIGLNPCSTCFNGTRPVGFINNTTFVMPTMALLHAHYFNIGGVFTDDFPGQPLMPYNYTGPQPSNLRTTSGTKVYRLGYNSTVQVVIQGTTMVAPESHPFHLHGFNFFAVGRGVGNYDPRKDPEKFNLIDPVERNTINVPTAGWTAIRFRADNPGVWFLHCHLEVHTSWGLKMAFVVDNGKNPNETIQPPPHDIPKC